MRNSDTVPSAGSIGEPRGKRGVPGREDVIDDTPVSTPATDGTLTLEDINLVVVLLDACAQRGAFKVEEFSVVGKLHDKLRQFVEGQKE
jgi:hypothetical protein